MSAFTNYVKDFPLRCKEILESFEELANLQGRGVTFLLSMASAGLCIPFQRLQKPNQGAAVRERRSSQFEAACQKFDRLMDDRSKFLASDLCSDLDAWSFGRLSKPNQEPDTWPELDKLIRLTKYTTVKTVVLHIRNALAHANLVSRGDPITLLIFVAKPDPDSPQYDYLAVNPDEFRAFMGRWFDFIEGLNIPNDAVHPPAPVG